MSAICGILRGSFADYLADALPVPQRRILREHLAACPACRRLAAEQDPTFVFARPIRDDVAPEETARILSAVKTGVAMMETEKRIRRSRRRVAGGSVAAAAAVAALVLVLPGIRANRAERPESLAAVPAATPSAPASDGAVAAAALADESVAPAGDATVYDWTPGAGREEPRVVWIVDRGLDI